MSQRPAGPTGVPRLSNRSPCCLLHRPGNTFFQVWAYLWLNQVVFAYLAFLLNAFLGPKAAMPVSQTPRAS